MTRAQVLPYVIRRSLPDGNGCWIWLGCVTGTRPRPVAKVKHRTVYVARLVLWARLRRSIRSGRVAAHRCDNGLCVNPAHIIEQGYSGNLADAWARGLRFRPPVTFTRKAST